MAKLVTATLLIINMIQSALLQEYSCDESWHLHNNHCYYVSDWVWIPRGDANNECLAKHANLTSILDREENDFIASITRTDILVSFWIGLRGRWVYTGPRRRDYSWVGEWSDGSPVSNSLPWGKNEPSFVIGWVCVKWFKTGWLTYNCLLDVPSYICKKPAVKIPVPTEVPSPTKIAAKPTIAASSTKIAAKPTIMPSNSTTANSPTTVPPRTPPISNPSPSVDTTATIDAGGTGITSSQGGAKGGLSDLVVPVTVGVALVIVVAVIIAVTVVCMKRRKPAESSASAEVPRAEENAYSSPPISMIRPSAPPLELSDMYRDVNPPPPDPTHTQADLRSPDLSERDIQDNDPDYTYIRSNGNIPQHGPHSAQSSGNNRLQHPGNSHRVSSDYDELEIHDNSGYVGVEDS